MADESIKLTDLSIKASNFKCFADEQGFDTIKPINVIIGKNNSGKSTLLDILELVFCWKDEHNNEVVKPGASHQRAYRIALSSVLNEKFSSNTAMEFDTRSDKGASIAVSPLDKEKIHSWV
ncbi:MAG: AAA family ATPase [Planctomycetota bacterium]|nr:AAA family ATPase [Planctomycetota bacterium]